MLPDLSVFWVISFVLLLAALLDRLLFRPIARVLRERQTAVDSARDMAHAAAEKAASAASEFERRTQAARAEVYREMDEKRRAALQVRSEALARTRTQAEAEVAAASAQLQAEATSAREQLRHQADAFGAAIVERVLGRKAS
jgi:F-type H+-transporting ATPase subunit b